MKFFNYISEEYCDLLKNWSGAVDVYENPTYDDLKELRDYGAEGIRFTAVNDIKKLFVWQAGQCNHADMVEYLVKRKHMKKPKIKVSMDSNLFNGYAELSQGKLYMGDSDDFFFFSEKQLSARLKKDWSWLKKYFVSIVYIKALQDKLKSKTKLEEKYIGSISGRGFDTAFRGGYTEIFINPTKGELKTAADAGGFFKGLVRFIADFKYNNLYVFKCDTLHSDVVEYIEKNGQIAGSSYFRDRVDGVASLAGGKLIFKSADSMTKEKNTVLRFDDKWTGRYFNPPLLQQLRNLGYEE